ncbi:MULTISPECIES: methylisocitrate lyase [unclassified Pigmentiphaga]|uniref:methylisocitrate lyase n=1 Tax=unclassified Pigmentiphaga TaxID=2626614 RepID=UPI000B40F14E|nr:MULTISPECIES: methylisocitrate lyase [unclassified Pigmentiphaga]OVZ65178.1 methylisocitrate lyase [Pigmentiphaga sp. NML030171]
MLIDSLSNTSAPPAPGARLRAALAANRILPIVGTINAYSAILAQHAGHQAIYLAGGGLATHSYGLPDLALTTMTEVLTEVRRITDACDLPLMVDVDTGFGAIFNIARLVKGLIKDGAAALHIEDQDTFKRCGHRPNKALVSTQEMLDRLKSCVDARSDPSFFIVARTDALATEGLQASIDRACAYVEAGADMVFAEACTELSQYQAFAKALNRPHSLLANVTEFSLTPNFSQSELAKAGVSAALYPLSAARAMAHAATRVYEAILRDESQKSVLDIMQTRDTLYNALKYTAYEAKYDAFLANRAAAAR